MSTRLPTARAAAEHGDEAVLGDVEELADLDQEYEKAFDNFADARMALKSKEQGWSGLSPSIKQEHFGGDKERYFRTLDDEVAQARDVIYELDEARRARECAFAEGRAEGRAEAAELARREAEKPVFEALAKHGRHLVWTHGCGSVPSSESASNERDHAAYALYAPAFSHVHFWDISKADTPDEFDRVIDTRTLTYLYSGHADNAVPIHAESEIASDVNNFIEEDLTKCIEHITGRRLFSRLEVPCYDPLSSAPRRMDMFIRDSESLKPLVVVEYNVPTALLPPGFFDQNEGRLTRRNDDDGKFCSHTSKFYNRNALNQLCMYMVLVQARYGVLSSGCATWLLKIDVVDKEVHNVYMSDPFYSPITSETERSFASRWKSGKSSSRSQKDEHRVVAADDNVEQNPNGWSRSQALFYVTCLAVRDRDRHMTDFLHRDKRKIAIDKMAPEDLSMADGLYDDQEGPKSQVQERLSLQSEGTDSLGSQPPTRRRPSFEMDMDFAQHKIVPAMCEQGVVLLDQICFEGAERRRGTACVVKLLGLLHSTKEAQDELAHEVEAYESLRALQGRVIPRVLFGGHARFDRLALVLTVEGVTLYDDRGANAARRLGHKAFTSAALDALSELHRAGYLHGDVALRNVVVDPETLQVKLIDLGRAMSLAAVQGDSVSAKVEGEQRAMQYEINRFFSSAWSPCLF